MEKKDSKARFFPTWDNWLDCLKKSVLGFVKGFVWTFYTILVGIAMLFYNAFLFIKKVVLKFPIHALSVLCVTAFVLLIFNYVSLKTKIKTCEAQRDSIGYELYKIEKAFGGDTIIIGGRNKILNNVNVADVESKSE